MKYASKKPGGFVLGASIVCPIFFNGGHFQSMNETIVSCEPVRSGK
jgi:hypothetical protein